MSYLLALDQGTSSSRSIVFDVTDASSRWRSASSARSTRSPAGSSTIRTRSGPPSSPRRRRRWPQAGLKAGDVKAIGITNQRETTVVWDRRTGEPLHNAIVWQDRRAEPTCAALRAAGHEADIRDRTGLIVDAYFSGTKLKWILDHVPGARAAAARGEIAFGTVDAWLMWQLTGGQVHATDVSNASRTMLFNVRAQRVGRRAARVCSTSRARCCPRSIRRATSTAIRAPNCWARAFRSPAWPATSRVPSSARPASAPGWRRTPTAPAASC